MLKTYLADPSTSNALHVVEGQVAGHSEAPLLVTTTLAQHHGVFKSITTTTTGAEIVTAPSNGGAIVLTDLVVSAEVSNGNTVTVRFSDGSNTVNVGIFDQQNGINFGTSFIGLWRGWKDARLEVIASNGAAKGGTVSVGYYKVQEGLAYSDWDARR